ncbi:hypothetical protein HDU97_001130 [Phlyctochytrium planicorne]|nr:hypothetical protein HDU97_001130 [Phlyctochytrium planicorne]
MCGHVCDQPCHGTGYCTEDKPCKFKVSQVCACLNLNVKVACGAWKASQGASSGTQLPCDESCAKLDRNRRLAEALNLTPPTPGTPVESKPGSVEEYEDALLTFALGNPALVKTIEATLADFVNNTSKRLVHFPHANYKANRFIATLIPHYNLVPEIVDAERKQASVIARKTAAKTPWIPYPLISLASKSYKGKSSTTSATASALTFGVRTSSTFGGKTANGFFIMGLQDGIETKDIEILTEPFLGSVSICWVGEKGDCLILPTSSTVTESPATFHAFIIENEGAVSKKFLSNFWATAVYVCRVEEDGSVIRFSPSAWQEKPAQVSIPAAAPSEKIELKANPYLALESIGEVLPVANPVDLQIHENWEDAVE